MSRSDGHVVEPRDVEATRARRAVGLQRSLLVKSRRVRDALVDDDVGRARVEQEVVGLAPDRHRHVEVTVAQRQRDPFWRRHVDRARVRRCERRRRNRRVRLDLGRDRNEIVVVIAVRDEAAKWEPVAVDLAPIGQIDRRASVVVVVGDAVGEAGLRIEVQRLGLAARRGDVEHVGRPAEYPGRAAVDRILRLLPRSRRSR